MILAVPSLLMTAQNITEFLTKKRMLKELISQWHQAPLSISILGSVHQCNSIQLNASTERRPGLGLRVRNAFRILHYILFPVKSFKIAARSFRVPWLVGSSHYSPITTLPYHYNTFLARHIWPVPVSEMGGRSFY